MDTTGVSIKSVHALFSYIPQFFLDSSTLRLLITDSLMLRGALILTATHRNQLPPQVATTEDAGEFVGVPDRICNSPLQITTSY